MNFDDFIRRMFNRASPPYVVLVGQVGVGKSTIVEKLTKQKGLSSDNQESFTRSSLIFQTNDIMIADTPGTNSMTDKFEHNLWVAQAVSSYPVSLIGICVEAHVRIDGTMSTAREFLERFQDFEDMICIIVSKMDTVNWTPQTFMSFLKTEFGLSKAIFNGTNVTADDLLQQITKNCNPPKKININEKNFLKYFKIHNDNFKILGKVNDEVSKFETIQREFKTAFNNYPANEQIDLIFEFQTFMTAEIDAAQSRVIAACGFDFVGEGVATQYGHIANLTNRLKNVLFEVRTIAVNFQGQHSVSALRKCPHCGCVWTKVAGCDGNTICGQRVGNFDSRSTSLATYNFILEDDKLTITKKGTRNIGGTIGKGHGAGCGQVIAWKDMAPVAIPEEFKDNPVVTVEDIQVVRKESEQSWHGYFKSKKDELVVQVKRYF